MKRLLTALALLSLCAVGLFAQATSVSGTVNDPTGAVIPSATVTIESSATGVKREDKSDTQGRYNFAQLPPGTYKISAKASGFNDVVINEVRLLVNSPATINLTFEKVGSTSTTIAVNAEGSQINTVDATLGNAIGDKPILQLPFEGRNVVGLLAIQPGVTFIKEPDPGDNGDYRSGAVNGGKSDQANVTLDGVDVNDQQNRNAFTSVLRVSLDSVQEFRTTTLNAGADQGRSSGAQVALVTKSGTNNLHGSAYEFNRNTATTANTFFNNLAGVPRETLIRNVYGASLGGPIKKNRLFFFLNYEGRKDRSQGQGLRIVPNADFRQGIFTYVRKDGTIGKLSPSQVKAQDPAGIGPSAEVLKLFQSYPLPNDNTVGDNLNTSGFRFNAPRPLNWQTYIAKMDYSIDSAGKHQVFVRGQLQQDNFANGLPRFPGDPPSSVFLENSKGIAIGYTALLSSSLVSNFRYGLTRQGTENTGVQQAAAAYFRNIDDRYPQTRALIRTIPVNQVSDDFNWTKGAHNVSFGGVVRIIRNNRLNAGNSFSELYSNSSWLSGTGAVYLVADAVNSTPYRRQFNNLLGVMSQATRRANYDLQGNVLPDGAIIPRKFAAEEYEMYIQDTWKVTRALTITAGLRYSLLPPVYEQSGYQTSANVRLGDWFNTRGGLADQGKSQVGAGAISYDLASKTGRGLYDYFKNWQPRLAMAYSPQGNDGLSKFLFGGPGKTSIRAGFGLYYDILGQSLIRSVDATSLGFSTSITNPATASALTAPRFAGFYNVPQSALPVAPKGGFPQTYPNAFAITNGLDDTIKAPYTMNMNFTIGREFGNGWFVQGSYAGRLSRRSLIYDDLAMPTNLKDPASGTTYFDAATALVKLAQAKTATSAVGKIPFWENMYPGAAKGGLSATQNMYNLFKDFATADGDYTTALTLIDGPGDCDPACSKLGENAMFNSQYSSLAALRSRGQGNYHGMQWTVRKRFTAGYQFDFNYTYSKSTDFSSSVERGGATGGGLGQIRNSWSPGDMKAVSDYDQTHIFSMQGLAELPVGKGKKFLNNPTRLGQILAGGWQVSGIWRQTTGFVNSVVMDSGWPTNWNFFSWATQTGDPGARGAFKNAPTADGSGVSTPNIFANPKAALAAYTNGGLPSTLPGGTGQRNGIRGAGLFNIDLGLSKRFDLFTFRDMKHTLQIRAEAFNVTNTTSFDVQSSTVTNLGTASPSNFGKYTDILNRPRVFQFGARYEF